MKYREKKNMPKNALALYSYTETYCSSCCFAQHDQSAHSVTRIGRPQGDWYFGGGQMTLT